MSQADRPENAEGDPRALARQAWVADDLKWWLSKQVWDAPWTLRLGGDDYETGGFADPPGCEGNTTAVLLRRPRDGAVLEADISVTVRPAAAALASLGAPVRARARHRPRPGRLAGKPRGRQQGHGRR